MQYFAQNNTQGFFPARIKRTAFFLRGVALLLAGLFAGLLVSVSGHTGFLPFQVIFVVAGASLFLLVLFAAFRSLFMPRLVDMGIHPAWSLLFFVHALSGLFLLALLLVPSDSFDRRRSIV